MCLTLPQSSVRFLNSVQVVFVISYHSTQKGGDRLGFVSLLRHATTFIKDLQKYKSSVAVVVTKVRLAFAMCQIKSDCCHLLCA